MSVENKQPASDVGASRPPDERISFRTAVTREDNLERIAELAIEMGESLLADLTLAGELVRKLDRAIELRFPHVADFADDATYTELRAALERRHLL